MRTSTSSTHSASDWHRVASGLRSKLHAGRRCSSPTPARARFSTSARESGSLRSSRRRRLPISTSWASSNASNSSRWREPRGRSSPSKTRPSCTATRPTCRGMTTTASTSTTRSRRTSSIPSDWLDARADLSRACFVRDVVRTVTALRAARPGMAIVTFHGSSARMPASFELRHREASGSGWLRLWIKRHVKDDGSFFIEDGGAIVLHNPSGERT